MKGIVLIIQTRIRFFLLMLLLFHGSTKTFVFAKTLPSQSSKAAFTNLAIEKLNPCERAVWSCCQSDRQAIGVPVRCFERNGCVGLHWLAEDVCSTKYRDSIEAKINKLKTESAVEKKQNDLGSRGVYSVVLKLDDTGYFGLSLKQFGPGYLKISRIKPQGPAYKNGRIAVGDEVIAINDVQITATTNLGVILTMVKECGSTLKLMLKSQDFNPVEKSVTIRKRLLECKVVEECDFFKWYVDGGNYGKGTFTKEKVDAVLMKHACGLNEGVQKVKCPIETSDNNPELGVRTVVASKGRSECSNPDAISALELKHVDPDDFLENGIINLPPKKTPLKQNYKNLKKGFPVLKKHVVTKASAFGSCFCWKLYNDISFKGDVKILSEGDEIDLEFNLGSIKRVPCSELEDDYEDYYEDG